MTTKSTQSDLRKDMAQLALDALEQNADAIYLVRSDGHIFFANPAACRCLGRTRKDVQSLTIGQIDPTLTPDVWKQRWKVLKRKHSATITTRHMRKDGTTYPVQVFGHYVRTDSGEFCSARARDISEEVKLHEMLVSERSQLLAIFDAIPAIVDVVDPRTNDILFLNKYAQELFGKVWQGKKCFEVFHGYGKTCEFCNNDRLEELKDKPARWEYYSETLHRHFFTTNRAIKWSDGRDVKFEHSIDITERKSAEDELRKYRDLLDTIINALPLPFFAKDRNGRYILLNDSFLRFFNVRRNDIIGKTVFECWPTEDARVYHQRDMELMETREHQTYEHTMRDGAGEPRHIVFRKACFHDADGKIAGLVGTLTDITERKAAEDALRESESKFRHVVESSPLGMHFYDLDDKGRLIFMGANPAAEKILGVPHAQFIGKPIEEAFPALATTSIPARYREVAATGKGWSTEQITYEGDDIHGVFEVHAFQTTPMRMVAAFQNITNRIKAEHEIRRLAAAVHSAAETIIVTDVRGKMLYVNPSFEKMTGYTAAEALGKTPAILRSGKHDAKFYAGLWDTLAQGGHWRGRFTNRRKDGSLFEEDAVISPVRDENGKTVYYVAVKRDVTQELLLERQLRQSQKMEALGSLAGGIAHEFTNMLVAIISSAQLVKMRTDKASDIHTDLDNIIQSGNRLSLFTTDLLAFAHQSPVALKRIDLNRILSGVRAMIERAIGKQIEIIIQNSDSPLPVMVDPSQIEQAIVHLAVNATEAIAERGRMVIETHAFRLNREECVQLQGRVDDTTHSGAFAALVVTDTGTGFTKDMLSKVFDPFFKPYGKKRGSGLGLATAHGIVEQHNGYLTVYSVPGHGSAFTMFLPMVEAAPIAEKLGDLPRGRETILIVEDERVVRNVLVRQLQQLGYTVLESEDFRESLELASQHQNNISLVIADFLLPEVDGRRLATEIRNVCPDIKVLFASGFTRRFLLQQGLLKEDDMFIAKPFSIGSIARAVRQALGS